MCACVLHTRGTRLVLLANIAIVIVSYYRDYRWYRYYRSALVFRHKGVEWIISVFAYHYYRTSYCMIFIATW